MQFAIKSLCVPAWKTHISVMCHRISYLTVQLVSESTKNISSMSHIKIDYNKMKIQLQSITFFQLVLGKLYSLSCNQISRRDQANTISIYPFQNSVPRSATKMKIKKPPTVHFCCWSCCGSSLSEKGENCCATSIPHIMKAHKKLDSHILLPNNWVAAEIHQVQLCIKTKKKKKKKIADVGNSDCIADYSSSGSLRMELAIFGMPYKK